jgi:aminoglycoside phosphotransferase family enzyme
VSGNVRTPDLAARVAFLRRAGSYPSRPGHVRAIETHMSWLFLTDHDAYKLKKPVRRNGIDHRTPTRRRLGCQRELRLNRRLAPEVYLEVVPLRIDAGGHLTLTGEAKPIDSLVRMRRLPEALTLDHRLRAGAVHARDAQRIVARLAPFFAGESRIRTTPAAYRRDLRNHVDAAAAQLRRPAYGLDRGAVDAVATGLRGFLDVHHALLDARVRAGRIGEGHGDLRPEHIYLTTPPAIIDCIEFDRRLRCLDPTYELAFLAMECDRCAQPRFDAWLFTAYRRASGDDAPRALIDFYKAHNAYRRARIAIWHLDDPETGSRRRWIRSATDYLRRASDYLAAAGAGGRRRVTGRARG